MNYQALLNLNLTHTYYADTRCRDFTIVPDAQTQTWLRNHRAILRTRPDGVTVLITTKAKDTPLIALANPFVLRFDLQLRNPDFMLVTDLPATPNPIYANSGNKRALQPRANAQAEGTPPPFARVELSHRGGLTSTPVTYTIDFEAKKLRWVYFLVTPSTSSKFTINTEGLTFNNYEAQAAGASPVSIDTLNSALTGQFADRKIVCLASKQKVACQQAVRKAVGLSQNQTLVIRNLPNPKPTSLALLGEEPVLYEVVKLLPVTN